MNITAKFVSIDHDRRISISREGKTQEVTNLILPTGASLGTAGAEYLLLALVTSYSSILYREADKRGIGVEQLEVDVEGRFGVEGEPARSIVYRVILIADAPEQQLRELVNYVDRMAEIHNTLRLGLPVTLNRVEAITV